MCRRIRCVDCGKIMTDKNAEGWEFNPIDYYMCPECCEKHKNKNL